MTITNSRFDGTFVRQGTFNDRSYWKSSADVFLYYAVEYGVWALDDNLDTAGIYDYVMAQSQFPPSGAVWEVDASNRPIITCSDTGEPE